MFSLFCEAKFWTLRDDIQIRNIDFGVFRYYDKKEIIDCPYLEGKKSFCHQRGTNFTIKNKRPLKLRDSLKELENHLTNNKIVFYNWITENILYIFLNSGLIVAIGVNLNSKDIYKITFDRFLIGKLLSENVCDVISTRRHLVISYNENQLTVVYYTKPCTQSNLPQKLIKLEPKIQLVDLCGPIGRRLDRHLSASTIGDMFLTWWHTTRNEVYPWSPLVKDEDRANIHIYSLKGTKIELLCFYQSEYDLINVKFSKIKSNLIWMIEQHVSKKGDVIIEYSSYEIVERVFKKVSSASIPLHTQICCHNISPDEERLLLGCIDGSIVIFDEPRRITRVGKTAFIPNLVLWHNDGALIVIANERGQFQFFDLALSCIRSQLLSEDVNPSNVLDLSSYFKSQLTLLRCKWNKKSNSLDLMNKFVVNDGLLLLVFENGPLGVLNLIGGGGLLNDVQNSGLTSDVLIRQYLLWNQSDKALNLLLSLNWDTNGLDCLSGLYHIANYIFRHPFTPEREIQLEAALGSFYAPIRPLTRFTENEYGNQVHDLSRRFFHHLLRYRLYEKAFCLAIDLGNADLFVDLYHCAKLLNNEEMAYSCSAKVEECNLCSDFNSLSSHSLCSHSSCSCSSTSEEDDDNDDRNVILPPLPQVSVKKSKASRVPPLPDLNRHNKLRGSAFFNRPTNFIQTESMNFSGQKINPLTKANNFQSPIATMSCNEFYPINFSHISGFPNHNLMNTRVLSPDFIHSYEIRTSFSEEPHENNFTPIKPHIENRTSLVMSPHSNSRSTLVNSNYVRPSFNIPIVPNDRLKRNPSPNRLNLNLTNSGPLELKPVEYPKTNPSHCHMPRDALNTYVPKYNSFDYLLSQPVASRLPQKQIQTNQMLNRNYLSKNFTSRPLPYLVSNDIPDNSNKLLAQNPGDNLSGVQPKENLKLMDFNHGKQKVKFSGTITEIVVPNSSEISIEDETLTSKRNKWSPKLATSGDRDSNYSVIEETNSTDCNSQQDLQEEEGTNGIIKVIHFGVV